MTTKNPKEFWSKREKFEQPDECYTPENAIIPLLQFILNNLHKDEVKLN